jgi:hypothetical protein
MPLGKVLGLACILPGASRLICQPASTFTINLTKRKKKLSSTE